MENGAISDGQITASSKWDSLHEPYQARLHFKGSPKKAAAWSAGANNINQWLQVDLGDQYTNITHIATQGRANSDQRVTKYNLQYSIDGTNFVNYTDEQGQTKVM